MTQTLNERSEETRYESEVADRGRWSAEISEANARGAIWCMHSSWPRLGKVWKEAIRKISRPSEAWITLEKIFKVASETAIDEKLTMLQNIQLNKGEAITQIFKWYFWVGQRPWMHRLQRFRVEEKGTLLKGSLGGFDDTTETIMASDCEIHEAIPRRIVWESHDKQSKGMIESALVTRGQQSGRTC